MTCCIYMCTVVFRYKQGVEKSKGLAYITILSLAWYQWPIGLEYGLFYDYCGVTKNFLRSNSFMTYEKDI